MIEIILVLILLVVSIIMVLEKNNLNLIIYYFVFSFLAASLYFLSKAPDIALAEIAVGCAFVPIIYLIAISKQNEFNVLLYDGKEALENLEYRAYYDELYYFLSEFCDAYKLDLNIITKKVTYYPTVHGVFRSGNVDLIAAFNPDEEVLWVIGNRSNFMYPKLEAISNKYENIMIIRVRDDEN